MPTRASTALVFVAAVLAVALVWPTGASAARYGSRTLAPGARGGDVKQLQGYLTRAGHRTRADGAFGRRTARALRVIERELELRADGVATPPEQQAIRRAVARPAGSPSSVTSQRAELVPGAASSVSADGLAVAPAAAPQAVKDVVAAANQIAKTPYKWGGGHGRWEDSGYDCSGSVSYALHGAGLLDSPLVSGAFARWGASGPGSWITIYANRAHVFMVVAGSRFDTSARSRTGSRWTSTL